KESLADYLLGKNHFARGRWVEAAAALDQSLERGIEQPMVLAEALRTRLMVACALGQKQAAKQAHERLSKLKDVSLSRREWMNRLAERCGVLEPKPPQRDRAGDASVAEPALGEATPADPSEAAPSSPKK